MHQKVRVEARVEGIVQGVGFRPFAYALACRLGLAGRVGNDAAGVFLELEGDPGRVAEFFRALRSSPPPLARVARIRTSRHAPRGVAGFAIAGSDGSGPPRTWLPADVATCADCLRELADPADRRYRYPFLNCTNCGPRFTIVRALPYDRSRTTMAGFPMCDECSREYHDPADRRFHAQPVCCPACGPRLVLTDGHGTVLSGGHGTVLSGGHGAVRPGDSGGHGAVRPGDPVREAVRRLAAGEVLAVKGLGGYHLAVDAGHEAAVAALRQRKRRAAKPFAVMVPDLAAAAALCELPPGAADLLTGPARPIVLLPRRGPVPGASAGPPVAAAVAPGGRELGVMLPYTPLHHLLLRELARPVVLTSGNRSDEPIACRDADAFERLGEIADAFLTHDRAIHARADDSVTRPFRGRALPVRRSRGHAPHPVPLPVPAARPVLGCGAELKNTVCLATGRHAVLSPHIGDLTDYLTHGAYRESIDRIGRLFGVIPEVVAHDLHPDYLATAYALGRPDLARVAVQHHHAHIAACLVDNGETGPVLGVAFDGLGYGPDGTLWGGEFLLADLAGYTRVGQLAAVPMPGGASAVRQPWRMAVSYLDAAFGESGPPELDLLRRHAGSWPRVRQLARSGTAAPLTSSAGRLFDAVAAILGLADRISYEGQAAVALEQLADPATRGAYPVEVAPGPAGRLVLATGGLVRQVVAELRSGVPAPVISARFHRGLAAAVVTTCARLADRTGCATVALSGGVFQNLLLLTATVTGLERVGLRALVHSRVPPNDGGISLGQVAVAAARSPLA